MLKEEKIREISNSINEIREDIIDYRQIYQCTRMVFDAVFGLDTIFEGDSRSWLSVNIEKIISELGMEIIKGNCNLDELCEKRPFYIAGTVKATFYHNRKCNAIFMQERISDNDRRLVLAIHMYYYLKHYNDERIEVYSPLMPLKYNTMEDIVAKIFARMILLPPATIADEFYTKYKGECDYDKGCIDRWYEYLSIVAKVSKEEAIIGWQEARIVLKLLD